MTEENNEATASEATQANGQIAVQKVYVKDVSFEVPNAPAIFQENGQLDLQLNLAQTTESLAEDVYDVTLTVTATTKVGETTAYLAEVKQAGIFTIKGFEPNQTHAAVGIYCPTTLFPYARAVISDLVAQGGFPPLTLQHVNFETLYADQMRKQQEQQAQES